MISKFDRFDSRINDDTSISCVVCGGHTLETDALYDEKEEHYYCDDGCFEEWCDDNFAEVVNFYKGLNVDY